jgi:hypothetical protein
MIPVVLSSGQEKTTGIINSVKVSLNKKPILGWSVIGNLGAQKPNVSLAPLYRSVSVNTFVESS